MGYLIIIIGAYLLGSSNLALCLFKWKKVDARNNGSGNLGASNATLLLGWGAGIAVAAHDIGKSLLAVILSRFVFHDLEYAGAAAGVACVLGHIFPFYLKFRGGKGFASYIGMIIALNWKFALVVLILVGVVTLLTDYLVAGTTLTIVSSPIYLGWSHHNMIIALILCVATAVIIYKHWDNYVRIWKGTEIGLRSAAKGEHRIK